MKGWFISAAKNYCIKYRFRFILDDVSCIRSTSAGHLRKPRVVRRRSTGCWGKKERSDRLAKRVRKLILQRYVAKNSMANKDSCHIDFVQPYGTEFLYKEWQRRPPQRNQY